MGGHYSVKIEQMFEQMFNISLQFSATLTSSFVVIGSLSTEN